MPLPQDALDRQQAAIFDVLGKGAQWEGVADVVRVKLNEADETVRTDYSDLVARGRTIKVRARDVAQPADGDQVQVLDASGDPVPDALFIVDGEPTLDRRGVWHCPVKPAA